MADTFETNVAVSAITVPAIRLRHLRPDAVSELAASIRETGLLQAISVRSTGAGRYALIFGRHRLEAVRRIGSATIRARILKGITDLDAEMQEIDENLVRADLSPAEHAMHIGRRKEIYEKQHPQTRAHVAGAHAANALMGNASANLAPAFTADTAAKTGRSERVIQRHATRADHIANLADTVGTSLDTGEELDALARMPSDAQADVIQRAKAGNKVSARVELKKQARDTRERDLAEATVKASAKLGSTLYGVIMADPPWRFEPYSRDTGLDRAADNHYPTMTLEDIKAVKIPAARDCVLFLWRTAPMMVAALEVMQAWGFTYRTEFVWVKNQIGTGYWNRNRHEVLMVGTRGNVPAPAPGQQFDSVIEAAVAAHSAKPDAAIKMIERMFPHAKRLDMYARGTRAGWDAFGNQVQPSCG